MALATAAESFVGVPFRLHGRDPAYGLDCVGLVAAALATIGRPARAPSGYRMRQVRIDGLLDAARRSGLAEAVGPIVPGDIVLARPGPGQFHLAIAAKAGGVVHAHAGLGRVVLAPPPLAWPVEHRWRLVAE